MKQLHPTNGHLGEALKIPFMPPYSTAALACWTLPAGAENALRVLPISVAGNSGEIPPFTYRGAWRRQACT